MERGKHICETLKGIRREIAQANEIDYEPCECTHEGDCAGTCPKCESETRWLERQLLLRQRLGKAVKVAGITLALASFSACGNGGGGINPNTDGYIENPDTALVEPVLAGEILIDDSTCNNAAPADTSAQTPVPTK